MLELVTDQTVDLFRSGARLGLGLFETIRVIGGRPWRLAAHRARLAAGAAVLGLDEVPPLEALRDAAAPLLARCGEGRAVLRLVALDGHLHLDVQPAPAAPAGPVVAGLADAPRRLSTDPLCRLKTLSWAGNELARREAERRGWFELLLPNEHGRIAEGSRTNVVAIVGDRALTPPVEEGCLPGIARCALLEAGLAEPAPLTIALLEAADAVVLVNALRGAIPVARVEGLVRAVKDAAHPRIAGIAACLGGSDGD